MLLIPCGQTLCVLKLTELPAERLGWKGAALSASMRECAAHAAGRYGTEAVPCRPVLLSGVTERYYPVLPSGATERYYRVVLPSGAAAPLRRAAQVVEVIEAQARDGRLHELLGKYHKSRVRREYSSGDPVLILCWSLSAPCPALAPRPVGSTTRAG